MMNRTILMLLPLAALAACGEQTPAPVPEETPSVEEQIAAMETIAAPDQKLFAETLAAACPNAKPVNTAVCKRAGLGSEDVVCEYGLGDDEYLRNKATMTVVDDAWAIADPETVCAQGA
ncbi:hypothetical protein G6N82_13425 [Altererythrobacter sp. BO-6]|uniref:hypothetical protein n=1 Tax=Altererythrobacter sp. BO-6 TaxID=2604537 RepID=UPI0013E14491|nr:hypothetical protein [Altererythrobacter sp. BO-6]QIG55016.1 hypothetical protein G6N82_13425 [Altererythrobacter sp. BO-6]